MPNMRAQRRHFVEGMFTLPCQPVQSLRAEMFHPLPGVNSHFLEAMQRMRAFFADNRAPFVNLMFRGCETMPCPGGKIMGLMNSKMRRASRQMRRKVYAFSGLVRDVLPRADKRWQ